MILKKIKLILFILFIKKDDFDSAYLHQRKKGIKKYGKPLEKCKKDEYEWKEMALQEIVDCYQYITILDKFKK
jgi:hypothetical protein